MKNAVAKKYVLPEHQQIQTKNYAHTKNIGSHKRNPKGLKARKGRLTVGDDIHEH